MYSNINKKIFHVIMIIVLISVILSIGGILILRYQVEGESNMPFKIKKISIIESVEGTENIGTPEKWNLNVNQNNDIYIYLEKNSNYGKTEIIQNVQIRNININKQNEIGDKKIYKPVIDEKRMFINSVENEITEITYTGELESNIKEQKISNQGGIIAFRYAINNLAQYISDTDEQIDHSQLLKLTNITKENLQTNLSFDLILTLISGKKYQATITLDVPSGEVIEQGTFSKEIKEFDNIIFKRIEN